MVPEIVFIFVRGPRDTHTHTHTFVFEKICRLTKLLGEIIKIVFFSHLFVEGEPVKPHLAPELDLQLVSIVELDGAAVGRRVLLDKESTELGEEDRVAHTLQVVDVNVRHPNVIHHVETEYSEYDCKKTK